MDNQEDILGELFNFLWQRLEGRRWKGYPRTQYNRPFVMEAAKNFIDGTSTDFEKEVFGLPMENSKSHKAIRRWIKRGLGDNHYEQIQLAFNMKLLKERNKKKARVISSRSAPA